MRTFHYNLANAKYLGSIEKQCSLLPLACVSTVCDMSDSREKACTQHIWKNIRTYAARQRRFSRYTPA
jgi:hypothetical protein